jgi:heme/copper-type cytochrome/quinol oxidase subunit 1
VPPLTRWFLRSAILCLVCALALGVATAALLRAPIGSAFAPFALHLLVVGWATQMIFGVAYWMFPRPLPERSFGHPVLGWTGFAGLNAGLLLRGVFEPWVALHGPAPGTGTALTASAVLQLVAVVAMVVLLWRRVAGR